MAGWLDSTLGFLGRNAGTLGSLGGAGVGFALGGPAGMALGAQAGGLLGSGIQSSTGPSSTYDSGVSRNGYPSSNYGMNQQMPAYGMMPQVGGQPMDQNSQLSYLLSQLQQQNPNQMNNQMQGFEGMEDLARKGFREQTLPSIAERFSGLGGQRSSAFGEALNTSGQNLESQLKAMRAQHSQQQEALAQGREGLNLNRLGALSNLFGGQQNRDLQLAGLGLQRGQLGLQERQQNLNESYLSPQNVMGGLGALGGLAGNYMAGHTAQQNRTQNTNNAQAGLGYTSNQTDTRQMPIIQNKLQEALQNFFENAFKIKG